MVYPFATSPMGVAVVGNAISTAGICPTHCTSIIVLFVTMGRGAYDDYKQYLLDEEVHSAKYLILEMIGV